MASPQEIADTILGDVKETALDLGFLYNAMNFLARPAVVSVGEWLLEFATVSYAVVHRRTLLPCAVHAMSEQGKKLESFLFPTPEVAHWMTDADMPYRIGPASITVRLREALPQEIQTLDRYGVHVWPLVEPRDAYGCARPKLARPWTDLPLDAAVSLYTSNPDLRSGGVGIKVLECYRAIHFPFCWDRFTRQVWNPTAAELVRSLKSYAYVDPERTGVIVLVRSTWPAKEWATTLGEQRVILRPGYVPITAEHVPGTPKTIGTPTAVLRRLRAAPSVA